MTDDEPETDACAQIARCHRHQYPADYGVPYVANALPTPEDQFAIAAMTVDRGPEAPPNVVRDHAVADRVASYLASGYVRHARSRTTP